MLQLRSIVIDCGALANVCSEANQTLPLVVAGPLRADNRAMHSGV